MDGNGEHEEHAPQPGMTPEDPETVEEYEESVEEAEKDSDEESDGDKD